MFLNVTIVPPSRKNGEPFTVQQGFPVGCTCSAQRVVLPDGTTIWANN